MKMRILALLLLFVSLDSFSMYWAKGGKKPSRPKQQSNKIVSASQEKTATEKLQELINNPLSYENTINLIEELIDQGANPNVVNHYEQSLLKKVIFWLKNIYPEEDQRRIIRKLIAKGADVNAASDYERYTPLMIAAWYNLPSIAEILLENGADISAKNYKGQTAIMIAEEWGNNAVLKVLRAAPKKNKIP